MSRLTSLQILRALAALAIALLHFQGDALKIPNAEALGFQLFFDRPLGAGVDLFFAISGFVMLYASRSLFGTPGAAGEFLGRRIARIVPLYWMLTLLLLAIYLVAPNLLSSGNITVPEIVKSFLFIPYAAGGTGLMQPVYKLGWTLNYEMTFYVVFALFLALPMRKAVAAVAVTLVVAVIAGRVLQPAPGAIAFWTDPIMLEFIFGMLIGLAYLNGRRFPRPLCIIAGLVGVAGVAVSPHWGVPLDGLTRPLHWGVPTALILGATVLCEPGAKAAREPGRFALFLGKLGDASYAIYLVHPLAIRAFRLVWEKSGLGAHVSPWLYVAAGMALLIPLSILIYGRFEKPVTQAAQNYLAKRKRPQPSVTPA